MILSAKILSNGNPLIVLKDNSAYIYKIESESWSRIVDEPQGINEFSTAFSMLNENDNSIVSNDSNTNIGNTDDNDDNSDKGKDGILASLQAPFLLSVIRNPRQLLMSSRGLSHNPNETAMQSISFLEVR